MTVSPVAERSTSSRSRAVCILPVIPAVALLLAPWLAFVNTATLWLGVPALFIWTSIWVLLIPVTLLTVERRWSRFRPDATDGSPDLLGDAS
ncbi:hypothetical protein [Leekyejoonella antrihumi]|uniref:DUF3311 domain-containing protein n=1 Tax=Leekyejoonella antrihumi TaxID=1660198 RepID=A0A563DV09_9MICO|nr:hypothetical protein [Leekyejoonella antrihumi]TWP33801.1 hypothetical protein FGL98_19645 [Leekyejoonella antrihumi]